jgi:hypothetical protein
VPRQAGGGSSKIETHMKPIQPNKRCAYRVRASLLCFAATISWHSFRRHLFRSLSWIFFFASHCHCSLRLISSHLTGFFFSVLHLISCLLSFSQFFPADHNCYQLFSCHLSLSHLFSVHLNYLFRSSQLLHSTQFVSTQLFTTLLMSDRLNAPHLISAYITPSQSFSALLNSSQRLATHLMSSHLFSPLLTSSQLFSHFLKWSLLFLAPVSSPHLISAHSQIISALLWPKTCSKTGSRCQSHKK